MNSIISKYMQSLTKEQVKDFAIENHVFLSEDELSFTYDFVKKNWQEVLRNPNGLHLERYQDHFSPENFQKIQQLIPMYLKKYARFLTSF